MATFTAGKIVVWERVNKRGKWIPYSAPICQFIEDNHKKDSATTVNLGDVDEDLKIYLVNFKDMVQISDVTGTKSQIRRRLCDNLGVLGRGFSWQWLDDNDHWNSYDLDLNAFIDCAFLEGKKSICLNRKLPGYNYEINFAKMIQINKRSKRKRKIDRFENTSFYPVAECLDDVIEVDKTDENNTIEAQKIFCPQFLSQEIPGTRDLEHQVNAYKRNVEGSEYILNGSGKGNAESLPCSKHVKYFSTEKNHGNKNNPYV